jgi:hypothetical protein
MIRFTKAQSRPAAPAKELADAVRDAASVQPGPATVPAAWPRGVSQLVQNFGAHHQNETGEVSGALNKRRLKP